MCLRILRLDSSPPHYHGGQGWGETLGRHLDQDHGGPQVIKSQPRGCKGVVGVGDNLLKDSLTFIALCFSLRGHGTSDQVEHFYSFRNTFLHILPSLPSLSGSGWLLIAESLTQIINPCEMFPSNFSIIVLLIYKVRWWLRSTEWTWWWWWWWWLYELYWQSRKLNIPS